mmetsp:Transcript_55426/g.127438  ORF Transcript_55426/g.127438 Transcript_55426/m.127438 type:complete len:231 (-) Transcript_55426:562-1254(-)
MVALVASRRSDAPLAGAFLVFSAGFFLTTIRITRAIGDKGKPPICWALRGTFPCSKNIRALLHGLVHRSLLSVRLHAPMHVLESLQLADRVLEFGYTLGEPLLLVLPSDVAGDAGLHGGMESLRERSQLAVLQPVLNAGLAFLFQLLPCGLLDPLLRGPEHRLSLLNQGLPLRLPHVPRRPHQPVEHHVAASSKPQLLDPHQKLLFAKGFVPISIQVGEGRMKIHVKPLS